MTNAEIIDFAQHKMQSDREMWLALLADVQQVSLEMVHQRSIDWQRLGEAAYEAAALFTEVEGLQAAELAA